VDGVAEWFRGLGRREVSAGQSGWERHDVE
jgi:hypothetical protein